MKRLEGLERQKFLWDIDLQKYGWTGERENLVGITRAQAMWGATLAALEHSAPDLFDRDNDGLSLSDWINDKQTFYLEHQQGSRTFAENSLSEGVNDQGEYVIKSQSPMGLYYTAAITNQDADGASVNPNLSWIAVETSTAVPLVQRMYYTNETVDLGTQHAIVYDHRAQQIHINGDVILADPDHMFIGNKLPLDRLFHPLYTDLMGFSRAETNLDPRMNFMSILSKVQNGTSQSYRVVAG